MTGLWMTALAFATGKTSPAHEQHVGTVKAARALELWPGFAVAARCMVYRDRLASAAPLAVVTRDVVLQSQGTFPVDLYADRAGRLTTTMPGSIEPASGMQTAATRPAPDFYTLQLLCSRPMCLPTSPPNVIHLYPFPISTENEINSLPRPHLLPARPASLNRCWSLRCLVSEILDSCG